MKKTNPTPLKGYEMRQISKYAAIVILIILIASVLLSSCSVSESLTEHNKHDYKIIEVGNPYIKVAYIDKDGNTSEKYIYKPYNNYKIGGYLISER